MAEKDVLVRPVEYCILRSNPKLRRMLLYRIKEYGITRLITDANLDTRNFYRFVKGNTKALSQLSFIRVCVILGIKIELHFYLDN
jgi:hypothetical protein